MNVEYAKFGDEYLSQFEFEGNSQPTVFVETIAVDQGVECDVYTFPEDDSKDLGIIKIEPGFKTPLQKVLQGQRTVEGHISGIGELVITRMDGNREVYSVDDLSEKLSVDVNIGDLMQWHATGRERLIAYEVCIPPYQDGRYENIKV